MITNNLIKSRSTLAVEKRKRAVKRRIGVSLLSSLLFSAAVSALDIYVAPNGNDNNDGTIKRPLKTLEAARDMVREEKGSESVNVYFRAGTYPVTKQVEFTAKDSGSSRAPIRYSSYNGETAFFDGLKKLDSSKFRKVDGSLTSRLHNSAKGKVWSAVITDAKMIELLKNPEAGISFNNRMLVTTATPNKGFLHIDKVHDYGAGNGTYDDPKGETFWIKEDLDFQKLGKEIRRGGRQAYIRGYISAAWYDESIPIQRFGSTGSEAFVLKDKTRYGLKNNRIPRFRIKNMLATLDTEREWFFDHTDNRLYLYPPGNSIGTNDVIGLWAGPQVIHVNGASHISFERFVFQNLGQGKNGDGAITVSNGSHVKIAGSTFRYIAAPLAPVNIVKNAKNCLVTSTDFYDNSYGSRLYGGKYDKNSITHSKNTFENNHFTQVDSRDFYGKAIAINGAGQIFRNNVVHNTNGQPITHSGVDHLLEYNEIFNVGVEEGDGGAAYTGAKIFSFGNKIQYNFVHHLITTPGITERAGFFSDDYDAGDTYHGNTLYKAATQSIKMNAGSGHTVTNNVIMDAKYGVDLLGRPSTHTRNFDKAAEYLRNNPDSNDKANYLGRAEKVIGDFVNNQTLEYNEAWSNSFWAKRYPTLKHMLRNPKAKLGMWGQEVRVYDNLFANVEKGFKHTSGHGAERGSITLDKAHFVNPAVLNFEFQSPRPSNYPDTKFASIGLKKNAYRKKVPSKNNYRGKIQAHWKNTPSYLNSGYNRNTINARVYFNTGNILINDSQRGLGVNESDARENSSSDSNNSSGDGSKSLQVRQSGLCIDLAAGSQDNGANIHQWSCAATNSNQDFKLVATDSGYYQIRTKHNKCLGVAAGSKDNGANLVQWACLLGVQDQQFKLVNKSGDWFEIRPRHSNKCLDVGGSSMSNGGNIHQWACHGRYNQQFKYVK